jgi:pyrimidine-specific ribonucleoside hydrolase
MVCLGPLTNVAENLVLLQDKIDRIIWYCSEDILGEPNFRCDIEALNTIEAMGIPLVRISNPGNQLKLNRTLVEKITEKQSIYASHLARVLNNDSITVKIDSGFFGLWDELCPVFLIHPELFSKTPKGFFKPTDPKGVAGAILDMLDGTYTDSRVFKGFPEDSSLFISSIGEKAQEIIERYGRTEWRAGVITNELHGHIGIYAIIGTKMGIRAREYFNIGVDDLSVLSHAGTNPPISCLNDGIQVSTGASVGHGLIDIDRNIANPTPEALFTCKNETIRISLKDALANNIREEVARGVKKYGLEDARYWEYIQTLAIRYWLELSRYEIFEIEKGYSTGD